MPDAFDIGFPIFANLPQLDLTAPWEVLARAPGARCHLVAHDLSTVKSAGGLALAPTTTFADCPPLHMLCVPGGPGHLAAMEDATLLAFLRDQAERCRFVTAVCTGSMVLAAAGLLAGYRATTHWASLDRLAFGAVPVAERVVTDRNRMTGGGVTAGIDFGLTVVATFAGEQVARQIQLQIEYAPAPPFGDGDPGTADPAILEAVRAQTGTYRQHNGRYRSPCAGAACRRAAAALIRRAGFRRSCPEAGPAKAGTCPETAYQSLIRPNRNSQMRTRAGMLLMQALV